MSEFRVNVDLADVEIDVKKVIDHDMTPEDTKTLLCEVFDEISETDKAELLCELFATMDSIAQKEALNDIVSEQLTDEQFHVMTEYFKKYGK